MKGLFLIMLFTMGNVYGQAVEDVKEDLSIGDLVPNLGVNLYKDISFSTDKFGDQSVVVYFVPAKGAQETVYYMKPYLIVDRATFQTNIAASCPKGADNKIPRPTGKVRVPIPFHVANEEFTNLVINKANESIADPSKKITNILPLKYHDLKLKNVHFEPSSGEYVSLVVANLDEYAAQSNTISENGFDSHALSFGSNSYAYDTCDNLELYNTGEYKLEVTAGVRKVQQNFFNLSSSSFTQSEAFLDLNRSSSQSGGIEYSVNNQYSDKGINILMSSTKLGANKRKAKKDIKLSDTRRRFVSLNLIKDAFHQHTELVQVRYENNFKSVNDAEVSKMIDVMTKSFFDNLEPVRVMVDIENSQVVNGNLNYDLNDNEKLSLQSTGHLQLNNESTASETVEANVDGAPVSATSSGQLNQTIKDERGVTYSNDGSSWVPVSIDLYAVDTVKESLQRNFNLSDVRSVGDNFYTVFPVLETNNAAFKSLADTRLHDFKSDLVDRLIENDDKWNIRFQTLLQDLNNPDTYRVTLSGHALSNARQLGINKYRQYGRDVCSKNGKNFMEMTFEETSQTFVVRCTSVQ